MPCNIAVVFPVDDRNAGEDRQRAAVYELSDGTTRDAPDLLRPQPADLYPASYATLVSPVLVAESSLKIALFAGNHAMADGEHRWDEREG